MSASTFQLSDDAPTRYERYVAPVMASFVERVIERAELREGDAVLDVACGTGFVARRAAEAVGPGGRVTGLDLNAGMLGAARRFSPAANIEWTEASALEVPLPDASFNAVLCQQGIQFFPERTRPLREMARLANVGGRVVVTCFRPLEVQPYFGPQLAAFERLLGAPVLADAFACPPEEIRATLADALGCPADTEAFEGILHVAGDLEGFLWGHALSLPVAPALLALGDTGRDRFVDAMLSALTPYISTSGIEVPVSTYLVVGRRA
ncbi:MAG: methyltransferase [Chloroflexi bacterium HGW-Chloroflexi-9]|nr:MAG: methyltransferase [Chloroflexi bacterium HGW-Chloroflexi-9]